MWSKERDSALSALSARCSVKLKKNNCPSPQILPVFFPDHLTHGCDSGTWELLLRCGRLLVAVGQGILFVLWAKEDSGCKSSWLPLAEAFG